MGRSLKSFAVCLGFRGFGVQGFGFLSAFGGQSCVPFSSFIAIEWGGQGFVPSWVSTRFRASKLSLDSLSRKP